MKRVSKSTVKGMERTISAHAAHTMRAPPHLAATDHEAAVTEFEQALICAAEAFYRFAGALLGPEARRHNLVGQDCVILQQLVTAGAPRRVGDLLRFANRDDVSNVQYSLRKLIKAGLVRQVKGATNRDTAYEITEDGSRVSARLVAQRRELLMTPTKDMVELDRQLRSLALSLGLLTGVYDHGTRVLARRMGESSGSSF
jgi:predicted MarR family transcription regulator